MSSTTKRSHSTVILCVGLLVALILFGVPHGYDPVVFRAIGMALFGIICVAGWKAGASAMVEGSDERRVLAVAGSLLVLPFALFAWLPGLGPPDFANAAQNQFRYLLLTIGSVAVACGFIVLRQALLEAGERFHSLLGFAAILLAGPLYTVFAAVQLGAYRAMLHVATEKDLAEWSAGSQVSVILLFMGVILTHLAAAAFAAALGRLQWIGNKARKTLVSLALVAAVCAAVNIADAFVFPRGALWGIQHAYAIPGFVFLIPAVPWMIPAVLGVVLLRRARL